MVGPSLLTDSHVCLVAVRVLWLGEGCVAVFRIGLVRVLVHVADLITAERVWLWLLCVFICVDMLGYKVSQQNNQVQIWQWKSITFKRTSGLNNKLFLSFLTIVSNTQNKEYTLRSMILTGTIFIHIDFTDICSLRCFIVRIWTSFLFDMWSHF